MPIKLKIILLFVLFSMIPFLIVGTTIFINFTNTLHKSVSEKLESIANVQKSRLDQAIEIYLQNTKLVASRSQIRMVVDEYNRGVSMGLSRIQQFLFDSLRATNGGEEITIFDTKGRVIAATNIFNSKVPESAILEQAQKNFFISNIQKNKDNQLVVTVTGPIVFTETALGIIEMSFASDSLTMITEDFTGLGNTGEVFIGRLRPDGAGLQFITPLRFDGDAVLNDLVGGDELSLEISKAIMSKSDISESTYRDYRGKEVLVVSRHIEGIDWAVGVKIDRSEAFAEVNDFLEQAFFFGSLIILFIGVFASFIASTITNPIFEITRAASRLETGDFSARVEIRGHDEISELGKVFNSTAQKLNDLYNTMDAKIKKRTRELEDKLKTIEETNVSLEETKKATINILEDLEEAKQLAEENRAKDEAVIESIGEGLVVTDEYGKIRKINPQAANILGWEISDLAGKYILDAITAFNEDGYKIPTEQRAVMEALSTGEKVQGNYLFSRKDGKLVPVFVTASPIMLNGTPVGVVEVFRDVTKEREVDKAKTEFVSLASHQLRTPLSAINWYTEMLLSGDAGEVNETQRKFLSEVYNGSQRMVELVNALLNVSRIDLGTFAIDPAPIEISEIAESVLNELSAPIHTKGLKVERNYDKSIGQINADPKLMRIILQNLLSNSVKYTAPQGKIGIDVSKGDTDVIIKIYDNGYGIPKEQQSKIFTKLFRADNAREIESDGTGLGLYIVKAVVEQSGGRIWFESAENKGSTFYVSIPLSGMQKKEGAKDLSPQI